MFSSIEAALGEIKAGKMVVVCDDENRENEGDLIMAAEFATQESVNFMAKEGRGLICVPLPTDYANRLDLPLTQKFNAHSYDCNFTTSVDASSVGTGISAPERAETIRKLADPNSRSVDFRRPGHVFPLKAQPGGVLVRAGHTEAAHDLCRLAGLNPVGVICEIMNEDGTMARVDDLKVFAERHELKVITIKDLIEYRFNMDKLVKREVEVDLPTEYGDFKLIAYSNEIDGKEHLALISGDISDGAPLVRVHSECFTGDVLGSKRCDCADQLNLSLEKISREGGVLLYMRQEGRGIGLINKLKAYKIQDQGKDTVEANHELGFGDDLRHYGIGAQILVDLGLNDIRLLTNNPKKIVGIEGYGLNVRERVPVEIDPNNVNKDYLLTKKHKLGHLLDLV